MQDGSLDPSFGNGGIAEFVFHGGLPLRVGIQPDGRIILVVSTGTSAYLIRLWN